MNGGLKTHLLRSMTQVQNRGVSNMIQQAALLTAWVDAILLLPPVILVMVDAAKVLCRTSPYILGHCSCPLA